MDGGKRVMEGCEAEGRGSEAITRHTGVFGGRGGAGQRFSTPHLLPPLPIAALMALGCDG